MVGTTTTTLDEALLRLYDTGYVTEAQNLTTPFLSSIGDASDFTFGGSDMRFAVEMDGNESVRFGTEDGLLPTPGSVNIKQAVVTAKELYATFRFTGRAQASTANSSHAFTNAVNGSISDAFKRAMVYVEGALFRDGTGALGQVASVASTTVTIDNANIHWFRKNQSVEFFRSGSKVAGPATITATDPANSTITIDSAAAAALLSDNDVIYKAGTHAPGSVTAKEILGLGAAVAASGDYLGLDRDSDFPDFRGHVIDASSAELDEDQLDRLEERIIDRGGVDLDSFKIVTSTNQRRKYLNLVRSQKQFSGLSLDAGYTSLSHNGRPMMFVYSCPADELYMGDFSKLQKYTLTGGEMKLSDIGGVIKWAPNYDAGFGYWRAYAEYAVRKPNAFGKLDNLATATL